MGTRWGSVGRFTILTTSLALAVKRNLQPQRGLDLLNFVPISAKFILATLLSLFQSLVIVCTFHLREVRTRPGYTANELNELYCLRCHDKMGIPICGACRWPFLMLITRYSQFRYKIFDILLNLTILLITSKASWSLFLNLTWKENMIRKNVFKWCVWVSLWNKRLVHM